MISFSIHILDVTTTAAAAAATTAAVVHPFQQKDILEIRWFDPSRFFLFVRGEIPPDRGSPQINSPGDSYYVNSCYVNRV